MKTPLARMLAAVSLASFMLLCATAASAQAPAAAAAPPPKNDYAQAANWLCRPDRLGPCGADLTTTVVAANGETTREAYRAARDPKIDCFYVYPTVSHDPTPNSDMVAGPEENSVVLTQFARFGGKCRLFAPLYRQVTLTALQAGILGKPMAVDRVLGLNDVRDAWNHYLEHDNHGRGVVLVGHSQGSGVLTALIKSDIDGKPVQARVISALLLGTSLQVPAGEDVGGDFQSMPLCRSKSQIGCVVAYASFRADSPPPENSRFGKGKSGMKAACVNPAAPAGGDVVLHSYWNSAVDSVTNNSAPPTPWIEGGPAVTTPFVSTPGLVSARCVSDEHGSYLAVTVHPSAGARVDTITGDVVTGGAVQKDWGLHLIDANLTMGDLVDLVDAQSRTYLARR